MKIFFKIICKSILSVQILFCQINPSEITIARDSFGVPHIYAKTDADVAYGLAWAHAEDDFKTIQQSFLAGNSILSKHLGKKGIPADFISQFIQSKVIVEKNFDSQISLEFKKILNAYAQGLNDFAKKYPEKVLLEDLFPVTPKKMTNYSQLQLFLSSNGGFWIQKILDNKFNENFNSSLLENESNGSNTIAFNSKKTLDGNTYFLINPHQPLDGPVSWYEAHLVSQEGTDILGALFPGSPVILIGTNKYLSWSHTVNLPDKTDAYKLNMIKKGTKKYKVDNEIFELETYKANIYIKILGIPIKLKKKYYKSIYGPTLKNKSGYYSIRTPITSELRALEQWWKMNKAKSFNEFYNILKMKALPGYNIGYADKYDTIFYISNGLIPIREKGFNWKGVVKGDTKETLWNKTYDIKDLPQVIQPTSGYIYNANHSPFKSTSNSENPNEELFKNDMGFEKYDNNRSVRIKTIIDNKNKFSYDDFKKLKYDNQLPEKLSYSHMNIDSLFQINSTNDIVTDKILKSIKKWNREANSNSYGAGSFLIFYHRLKPYYEKLKPPKIFTKKILIDALFDTKNYMLKYFGNTDIKLGDYQKIVRGSIEYPSFGIPDVLTAMHSKPYKNGKTKIVSGESYIQIVKFTKDGPEIESVLAYGNSDEKDSPHFDDQMQIYLKFKTKKMSLNIREILRNATKIYNPN